MGPMPDLTLAGWILGGLGLAWMTATVTAPPRMPPAVAEFSHRQFSSARQSKGNKNKAMSKMRGPTRMGFALLAGCGETGSRVNWQARFSILCTWNYSVSYLVRAPVRVLLRIGGRVGRCIRV